MNTDTDRRMMLAVVLSLAVWFLWMQFFAPPVPPVDAGVGTQPDDPLVASGAGESGTAGSGAITDPVVVEAPPEPVVQEERVPERTVEVTSPGYTALAKSTDGALTNLQLASYDAQIDVTPWWTWIIRKVTGKDPGSWDAYHGSGERIRVVTTGGSLVLAGSGDFDADGPHRIAQNGDTVTAERRRADGLVVRKEYVATDDPHLLEVRVSFENRGTAPQSRTWVGVAETMDEDVGRFDNVSLPVALVAGDLEKLTDPEDADKGALMPGPVSWFGLGDRYFLAALVPDRPDGVAAAFASLPDGRVGVFLVDDEVLAPGEQRTHRFRTFVGPKNLGILGAMDANLEESVEFGFFGFFSKILLTLLTAFQKGVVNWGVAIIMLTLLVKLVFYPLSQKSFQSSQAMKSIQPELAALKEKYKDDKELQTKETMRLFQEHKVNPMGGCLPMVVQMPVWFALYSVLWQSVELYDSSFLYLQDLTLVDPYGFLPTIVGGLMFLQQRLTPMPQMDDPAQKTLMRLMPFMFTIFMYSLPAGLVLYICINSTLSIAQMWHIQRSFTKEPVPA